MVAHIAISAGQKFVNNAIGKIIDEAKDDVNKAAKVALPISVPIDISRSVFRLGLYNFFFVVGMILAGIESMQNGDVKKALNAWINKKQDKQAAKVTDGVEHAFESGKSILSSFFGLFSSVKKSPKAKANNTQPDDGSETDVESVAPVVQEEQKDTNNASREYYEEFGAKYDLDKGFHDRGAMGYSPSSPRATHHPNYTGHSHNLGG
jgi:hypothetical protein